jgi:hypothetical protein
MLDQFFTLEKVANVNCFQILAQNDIIDAQAWIHKNNFM